MLTHNFVSTENWKFFEAFSLSSKGKGFLIHWHGLFVCYWFVVDECEKCDVDAICVNGHCKCKHGYYGNGYQCEKGKKNAYLLVICFRLHYPIYRKYISLSNDQRGISTSLIQITHEQIKARYIFRIRGEFCSESRFDVWRKNKVEASIVRSSLIAKTPDPGPRWVAAVIYFVQQNMHLSCLSCFIVLFSNLRKGLVIVRIFRFISIWGYQTNSFLKENVTIWYSLVCFLSLRYCINVYCFFCCRKRYSVSGLQSIRSMPKWHLRLHWTLPWEWI